MRPDEPTTWAVAIETHDRGGRRWMHAYDLIQDKVPHALPPNAAYEVHRDLDWRTAAEGPRCQHCLEIVGQYR